ncbi:MAG: iron-sulfur cluster assembly accessory protein [Alphaproteobacteria bacterium]|nr:iron-sulfur cluster assembly accessory protein [Alphaproteobacteria bacterium]
MEKIIEFTTGALIEIKRLNSLEIMANPLNDKVLRIGVKGGGCSGMTYILEFDQTTPSDEIFNTQDITYCIDKTHKLYLIGMTIDWENGLQNRGFTFKNPNASKTCGCGTSFAV